MASLRFTTLLIPVACALVVACGDDGDSDEGSGGTTASGGDGGAPSSGGSDSGGSDSGGSDSGSGGSGNTAAGGDDAGTGGSSASGDSCGGMLGLTCDADMYCEYSLEAMCGAADQTGTCQPRPEMCTMEYAPVCGCDGNTYSNACGAASAGTSVASEGEC